MGKLRKIEIDDRMPCDKNIKILVPKCHQIEELWPAIITKAILKLFSYKFKSFSKIDYLIGDIQIINALTGYFGELTNIANPNLELKKNLNRFNLSNNENNHNQLEKKKEKYFILCFNFQKNNNENLENIDIKKKLDFSSIKKLIPSVTNNCSIFKNPVLENEDGFNTDLTSNSKKFYLNIMKIL